VKRTVTLLACGMLMGVGLVSAHITRPEVIHGWLDFTGAWDPTLLLFFAPATAVFHCMFRWARVRERVQRGPTLCLPGVRRIDAKLVTGAALFGVGWALSGSCPGPALASLGAGVPWAFAFVAAMMAGLALGDYVGVLFMSPSATRARPGPPSST
jgi:uncharacterized membrane protein YedE/YeeE